MGFQGSTGPVLRSSVPVRFLPLLCAAAQFGTTVMAWASVRVRPSNPFSKTAGRGAKGTKIWISGVLSVYSV